MKFSWSHKIFLRINAWQGVSPHLDHLMVFCAHWFIYILVALTMAWMYVYHRNPIPVLVSLLLIWGIAIGVSYLIAFLLPHPRPQVELPAVKTLVSLYHFEEWKAFPSDHTLTAFLWVFVTIALGPPAWFSLALLVGAGSIAFARVYVGVHYPRDIVGGISLAFIFFGIWRFFFFA